MKRSEMREAVAPHDDPRISLPPSGLARYFGMSEGFFMGLQTDYQLMQRRREIGDKRKAIQPRAARRVGSA
jgi:hypothetical protein